MIDKSLLEEVLQFYNCPCEVIDTRENGGYCDYFLNPLKGTTINKLNARVKDFTVAIGQPVTVAIENMNIILRVVDAANNEIYEYFEYNGHLEDKVGQIGFGVSPSGEYVQYNLFDMPHLLVAGATGSGKSVFLHDAIISLMSVDIDFTLIDLKKVELSKYDGIKFVDGNVITDAKKAEHRLKMELLEMDARYKLMKRYRVSNYTNLPPKKQLKARVIIIDELADLMLNKDVRKSVENSIVRIAQLGRACGMHLIVATQRPSTDVVTGLIKANIPCKLAFMTSSAIDSRVIGVKGAENLNGRGDALLSIAGRKDLIRFKAFYISEDFLIDFIDKVRKAHPLTLRHKLYNHIHGWN